MLNFNEEIKKYKPILELNDIAESTREDEMADVLELLQYLAKKQQDSRPRRADLPPIEIKE